MEETEGGRDRRRRSRGSINGDMKGGEKKMERKRRKLLGVSLLGESVIRLISVEDVVWL